ncbi:hypothetical protein ACFX2K_009330 [Malus domestica]
MIHKAIKDVLVEKIKNNLQRENDIKREQRNGRKLKGCWKRYSERSVRKESEPNREDTTELDQNLNKNGQQTDEPENINISEAQTTFEQLFGEKMIKLDATVQKHIIVLDIVMSEKLFDKFNKVKNREEMAILKKKLEEGHSNAAKMEPLQILNLNTYAQEFPEDLQDKKEPSPVPNVAKMQVQTKTPIAEPIPNVAKWKIR